MTAKAAPKRLTSQKAQEIAQNLLHQLEFPQNQVEVHIGEEGGVQLKFQVGEGAGVLIGYHGEGLQSLQTFLALIFYRYTGQWQQVRVDIDGYLERRKEQLQKLAEEAVARVLEAGRSETLPYLSGNERRIIHELLSEDERVATESLGEGRDRRLVISPK